MSSIIPSHCSSCGAIFNSRLFSFAGTIKGLKLENNSEPCPNCGGRAYLAEGIFDIAGDVVSIISAPNLSIELLKQLGVAVKTAYKDNSKTDELVEIAENIDPTIGKLVKAIVGNNKYLLIGLFLLAMAIKSCSVNVKVDANKLIDQLKEKPPQSVPIETYEV